MLEYPLPYLAHQQVSKFSAAVRATPDFGEISIANAQHGLTPAYPGVVNTGMFRMNWISKSRQDAVDSFSIFGAGPLLLLV